MMKYGNHYQYKDFKFETDADVKKAFLANGIEFQELVEKCRNYNEVIPLFENFTGSTFISSNDGRASVMSLETGIEDSFIDGPGEIVMSKYFSDYEKAYRHIGDAIEKMKFDDLQSAIFWGATSIESYINYRAKIWNEKNPADKLIDSKDKKVSIDNKIDIWLPKMSNRKIDKGTSDWRDYIELRGIRDNEIVHAKSAGSGISYEKLGVLINKFSTGIAGTLFQLHRMFDEKIPAKIIRGKYAVKVELTNND